MLASPEQLAKTNDANVHYFSVRKLRILVNLIVMLVTVALMMIPTYWLVLGTIDNRVRAGIVLVVALVFPGVIAAFTRARSTEFFAATAA